MKKTFKTKNAGAIVWLTGLSGSGKSTIAEKLVQYLSTKGIETEHLDGDRVREVFPQTGFSHEERNMHVKRIGFLASLLEKHGVIVVASFISPYKESRDFIRKLSMNFIEVHIAAPIEECMRRDPKGLYKKAKSGEIKHFTGIDDPYEPPEKPELRIDTTKIKPEEAVSIIVDYLGKYGIIASKKKNDY